MLAQHATPIIAIATAAGRAAVGIVRISSPVALDAFIVALLGQPLKPRHAHYLPVPDADGAAIDHAIALHFPAPHSYSGEHVLEVQAHGGPIVLSLIVQRCLQLSREHLPSLRMAEPGEFTQRAFLNGKLDLAQAEAVADLIDATTDAAARSAGRSLSGGFSLEINQLREQLIELHTLVEATLDFPEEDIDFLERADAAGRLSALMQRIAHVRQRTREGALLREGMRIVIAGQPNAGKSSLLNALAGRELAIVTPIAGTTRDKLEQTIQIQGVALHITDTAGLRDANAASDDIERIGIERAWAAIAEADAVLFVHDAARAHAEHSQKEYQAADDKISTTLSEKIPVRTPILHIWNKADLLPHEAQKIKQEHHLYLSAHTGDGLEDLRTALLKIAGWSGHSTQSLFTARTRHVQAIEQVENHLIDAQYHLQNTPPALDLLAEELRLAQHQLATITGEFSNDDLLGAIFSKFCIGK